MTETTPAIGIIVTAEQIPLLRDIIVAQHLDVYISDTQNTLLLDDQWKPWIRRVKPQRAHCAAAVWLIAPNYSWPDHHSHPRIRDIIATQLQSCIHMAVMLGATGLVLPLEHAQLPFHERLTYYLNLIDDQLTAHDLRLMLAVSDSANVDDIMQFCQQLAKSYPLLMANAHTHETMPGDMPIHVEVAVTEDDESSSLPTWTQHVVTGSNENVSLIRHKVQWIQTQIAQRSLSSEEVEPSQTSEESVPQSSLTDANDEVA